VGSFPVLGPFVLANCHAAKGESVFFMPRPHRAEALSDEARLTSDVCLTSVCLSRTSGLSREQRGLGRLKLA